jgi:large subunit ribosomal protein L31
MKSTAHPTYYKTIITCNSCGKVYNLGSTQQKMKVELCSNCHPFYTGKEVLVDTDNLVDKFNKRKELAKIQAVNISKKKEKIQKRKSSSIAAQKPLTLRDMLSNLK